MHSLLILNFYFIQCGVPLLLDRIKQSMVSCREASVFFKKRAVLEEEYGRGMHKLAKVTAEVYAMNDGKAGYVRRINPSSSFSRIGVYQ